MISLTLWEVLIVTLLMTPLSATTTLILTDSSLFPLIRPWQKSQTGQTFISLPQSPPRTKTTNPSTLSTTLLKRFSHLNSWVSLSAKPLFKVRLQIQTGHPPSDFLHSHSPVWILICLFKSLLWEKPLWQTEHLWGRSPVWILIWSFKLLLWEKPLRQTEHLWGRSPVWIFIWSFKLLFWEKPLWQTEHLCGRSLWILMCILMSLSEVKSTLQILHL